jgi:hypothetical protein
LATIGRMPTWAAKLVAVLIGVAAFLVGYCFFSRGAPIVQGLNQSYARYPGILGRFRYPPWWHRLTGGVFMAWGLLVAVIGAWKAH